MVNRDKPTTRSGDAPLGPVELGILEAHHEAVVRKEELLPLLAGAVGVPEDQVFYTWALRRCKQSGRIGETGWSYFFHGLECDLRHDDGRFLRIDFGPRGRVDTFNGWGVLQFVMTSAPPWPEFPDLRRHLADRGPPFDEYSGSFDKMVAISDALSAHGAFEPADPELVALQARHTSVGPDGLSYIRFSPGTPDELRIDCAVAHRPVLSPVGRQLLEAYSASHPA